MGRTLIQVTPATDFVSLEAVKSYLNVFHDDDDALIDRLVKSAVAKLDGADGLLGRCLSPQVWRMALDCFPAREVRIPLPPLRSVETITYVSRAGQSETLDPATYMVAGVGDDGRIVPVGRWPETAARPESVIVTFSAGYDQVPYEIAQAIFQLVWTHYEERGTTALPTGATATLPHGFDSVVASWKVRSFG